MYHQDERHQARVVSENMTITLAWGPRRESALACAHRLYETIDRIPPQKELFSKWMVTPEAGASSPDDFLTMPQTVEGLAELLQAQRLVNDRGGVMDGGGFTFELARIHRGSPLKYQVRCGVELTHLGNHVQFDLPRPDVADPATVDVSTVKETFDALVEAWQPDHASVMTYAFRKAQKISRRGNEVPIGWLTYLARSVQIDLSSVPDSVDVTQFANGLVMTLGGTPHEPDLDSARAIRHSLGYATP